MLFYVDLKEYRLIERNTLSYSRPYSVQFICEKEVLVLTRELELHHQIIQNSKIRMKNKAIKADLPALPDDLHIEHCQLVGSIDEEQDSLVTLFYLIKKKPITNGKQEPDRNFEILKVKEYHRTFEGKIEPQPE